MGSREYSAVRNGAPLSSRALPIASHRAPFGCAPLLTDRTSHLTGGTGSLTGATGSGSGVGWPAGGDGGFGTAGCGSSQRYGLIDCWKRSLTLGGDAGQLGVPGKTRSSVSILRRKSSITREISPLSVTARGVMNSTSSLRLLVSVWLPKSPPRIGTRLSSGSPLFELPLFSWISPPITIVWPDGTAISVWIERVSIGCASPTAAGVPGLLTSACTSSVTRPPSLMCGVTCSSTPVSMYCDVVVTAFVVLPTIVCWLTGMRLPALIVAFWLSSAARWGLAMTFVLPYVSSRCSAACTPPGKFALLMR